MSLIDRSRFDGHRTDRERGEDVQRRRVRKLTQKLKSKMAAVLSIDLFCRRTKDVGNSE